MSQQSKIMELLKANEWTCTNEFYSRYIADPRKRLEELRKQGVKMEWRWCENENHNHNGHSKEWKLIEDNRTGTTSPEFNDLSDKFEVLAPKVAPSAIQPRQPRLFKPSVVRY